MRMRRMRERTEFGKQIKELCVKYAMPMKELARLTGMGPTYLSGVAVGTKAPNLMFVARVCKAIVVTEDEKARLVNLIVKGTTSNQVRIDVTDCTVERRTLAHLFAARFPQLDEQQMMQLTKLLEVSNAIKV